LRYTPTFFKWLAYYARYKTFRYSTFDVETKPDKARGVFIFFYTLGLFYGMKLKSLQIFGFIAVTALGGLAYWRYIEAQPKLIENERAFKGRVFQIEEIEVKKSYHRLGLRDSTGLYQARLPKSEGEKLQLGALIYGNGKLFPLPAPSHPDAFDYGRYLKFLGYSGILHLRRFTSMEKGGAKDQIIPKFRQEIAKSIDEWNWTAKEKAIYKALFLGLKSDLDAESRDHFKGAGLMHLLAVSGLHLGIVYLLLGYVARGFYYLKYARILEFILLIIGLWSFAFFTGAGASVLRAATMFSFLAFGKLIKRKSSGLRPVIASAIILYWINPLIIHQLGFQLSYSAVIGIIFLVPKLNAWHQISWPLIGPLQQIIYVSIAAQAFTLPLSLYYFGSFPSYFLISNLVLLPLMPLVMYVGFLILILDRLDIHSFLMDLYPYLLRFIEGFSAWISNLPQALLELSMSFQSMVLILCFYAWWIVSKAVKRKLIAMALCLWLGGSLFTLIQNYNQRPTITLYSNHSDRVDFRYGGAHQEINLERDLPFINPFLKLEAHEDGKIIGGFDPSVERVAFIWKESQVKALDSLQAVIYLGKDPNEEKRLKQRTEPLGIEFRSARRRWISYP